MAVPSDLVAPAARPRAGHLRPIAAAALLAGPTVLAFFQGGYFDQPRAWAGVAAWGLLAAGLLLGAREEPSPLHWRGAPVLAVGALAMLSAWTMASIAWAPVAGNAYHAAQIDLLYLGAVLAAAALLRPRAVAWLVEPALVLGALVVVGDGLSERFLPGVVHLASSLAAEGRLAQPLTYWNAMGELAAIGAVLTIRLAGTATRPRALRAAAAAAAVPLGLGLYLSFSRGALFACFAGLLALAVLAPRREQLAAIVTGLLGGGLAAGAAAPLRGVTAQVGSLAHREQQGVIALVALVVIMAGAAAVTLVLARRLRPGPVTLPRRAPAAASALILAALALAVVSGAKESTKLPVGASAARFTTLSSDRYQYWRVALDVFAHHPLIGVGGGGWSVEWLRLRTVAGFAVDTHSLELQTLSELGLIGLGLLLACFAGVWAAARAALRRAGPLAAGPVAALVVYLVHSPLDWDWQLPALTLVPALLTGFVLALAERRPSTGASGLAVPDGEVMETVTAGPRPSR